MTRTDDGDIAVVLNCNLSALRMLHRCVQNAYTNWPGGDPNEQVELEIMRNGLYAVLMETLLDNDLV